MNTSGGYHDGAEAEHRVFRRAPERGIRPPLRIHVNPLISKKRKNYENRDPYKLFQ